MNAAHALRQSCKLDVNSNLETIEHLNKLWKNFDIVSEEQLTRLRVSAIFFKSVDEQLSKLDKLKENIIKLKDTSDIDQNEKIKIAELSSVSMNKTWEQYESKMKKYLNSREQLLVEVGRMVRLGRLLKCRLRESFVADSGPDQ